jgi:hypothetical protein
MYFMRLSMNLWSSRFFPLCVEECLGECNWIACSVFGCWIVDICFFWIDIVWMYALKLESWLFDFLCFHFGLNPCRLFIFVLLLLSYIYLKMMMY